MLKQMRLIYSQGFSKSEKEEWRAIIFNNILTAFRVILDAMEELEIPFEDQFNSVRPLPFCFVISLAPGARGCGFSLGLWRRPLVRACWANVCVCCRNISHSSSSIMIWDRRSRYRRNT